NGQPDTQLITIDGDLTITGIEYIYFGAIGLSGTDDYRFNVSITGNLTINNPNAFIYSRISMAGASDQTITYSSGTIYSRIDINKPSGTINFGSNSLSLYQTNIYFVPNGGQIPDPDIKFYARYGNANVFFTTNSIYYDFFGKDPNNTDLYVRINFKLNFLNSNTDTYIEPALPTGTLFNYYLGNDPSRYVIGLTSYYRITYKNLYNGIDLAYTSKQGRLESEFIISPSGNYNDIRMQYENIDSLSLNPANQLIVTAQNIRVREIIPYAYQMADGREEISTISHILLGNNTYGFNIPNYDHQNTLVIDPTFSVSSFFGGNGLDNGTAKIAIDSNGNVVWGGYTSSTDFTPHTVPYPNGIDSSNGGGEPWEPFDGFVFSINNGLTAVNWWTFFGGSGTDLVQSVDTYGTTVYAAGWTRSGDLPTTANSYQPAHAADQYWYLDPTYGWYWIYHKDAFLATFSTITGAITYATYYGGNLEDGASKVVVDASGYAYFGGYTTSTSGFPTTNTLGAFSGGYEAFVAKLYPAAYWTPTYSTIIRGSGDDAINGITIDSSNNIYFAGWTRSSNWPTVNPYDNALGGNMDVIVGKLNSSGNALVYSTYLGGTDDQSGGIEWAEAIAIDSLGNAYVTGREMSTNFPTTAGAYDTTYNGSAYPNNTTVDVFVTKLNYTGTTLSLAYSTYIGGNSDDTGFDITVDSAGNAYIAGATGSTNFPTTAGAYDTTHDKIYDPTSYNDEFFIKLNPSGGSNGSGLDYSTFINSAWFNGFQWVAGDEYAFGILLDIDAGRAPYGNIFLVGANNGGQFPASGGFDTTHDANYDVTLVKFITMGVTVSGTASGLGAGYTIGISVNGEGKGQTLTTAGGVFSFKYMTIGAAGEPITLFIDDSAIDGSLVT
ncbi:MAG: SBBP repeat-containing protein, partial [Candidatus Omnitrophota bacterium]|nr:SBBP repeat-containing protein [Candidatus Omnitrophota bacterium]